jgi:catechol 2,3-dioxygenase-like lactoylglutathione lyase family enzyme
LALLARTYSQSLHLIEEPSGSSRLAHHRAPLVGGIAARPCLVYTRVWRRFWIKPTSPDSKIEVREKMIKPRRIGHATFETADLERMVDYYTRTMGLVVAERDKDRVFLTTHLGLLAIELNKGKSERCATLSFEVAPNSDFGEMARELEKEGIKSELRNDSVPGMGPRLMFKDNKGTTIALFKEWSYLGKHLPHFGVGPLKFGHIAFVVDDPQKTAEFYQRVLGFRISDWIDDFFVFMRCNSDHHTVNFIRGNNIKMHHIAFELKDFIHLQNSCDLFGQNRTPIIWGPVRLGPGHNIATFHRNPDDQVVELYCELDKMVDEELGYFEPRPWHRDTPQRPKTWSAKTSNIWGPPPLPDFFRDRT